MEWWRKYYICNSVENNRWSSTVLSIVASRTNAESDSQKREPAVEICKNFGNFEFVQERLVKYTQNVDQSEG